MWLLSINNNDKTKFKAFQSTEINVINMHG